MENKLSNMSISNPGGNASKNSKKYQQNIPTLWAKDMGITEQDKSVTLTYDDIAKIITIKKNNEKGE